MIYILDANALIAWLRDETGADAVLQIIQDINNTRFAHAANLCEVYFDVMRVG